MRHLRYLSLGLILVPTSLFAGQIYGSISFKGTPVARVPVEIACSGQPPTTGVTSPDGSYRLNVPQQGQCTLTLPGYNGRPSAVVFSYADPSQYDFELVPGPNGTYQLHRR